MTAEARGPRNRKRPLGSLRAAAWGFQYADAQAKDGDRLGPGGADLPDGGNGWKAALNFEDIFFLAPLGEEAMAVSIGRLIAQNWSTTPRSVTIPFLVIFAALSALFAVALEHEYRDEIYIRDHGVKSFGIVTDRSTIYKRNEFYIDYKYSTPTSNTTVVEETFTRGHEVSRENYQRYSIGSRIPIKYDPRHATTSHLDVQGYWSDSRLALSGALKFILFDIQFGVIIGAFWLLAGLMYRMFFAPAKGATGPADELAASTASAPSVAPSLPD